MSFAIQVAGLSVQKPLGFDWGLERIQLHRFSILGVCRHIFDYPEVGLLVTNRGRRPSGNIGGEFPEKFGPWKKSALPVVLLGVGAIYAVFGVAGNALDQIINSSLKARFAPGF